MANISVYLGKILTAIYGEEVRGSIHDALAAMNTESSQAMEYAAGAVNSAQSYASQALAYRNTTEGYKNDAQAYRDTAQSHVATAGNIVASAQAQANLASGYANEAKGYLNQVKEETADAKQYANEAKRSALDADGYEDNSKLYMERAEAAEARAQELIIVLQQYLQTLESFNEFVMDYEVYLPIQDSDGEAILDSDGDPLTSYVNGFKAFTQNVVDLQAIVARHTAEIRELQGA